MSTLNTDPYWWLYFLIENFHQQLDVVQCGPLLTLSTFCFDHHLPNIPQPYEYVEIFFYNYIISDKNLSHLRPITGDELNTNFHPISLLTKFVQYLKQAGYNIVVYYDCRFNIEEARKILLSGEYYKYNSPWLRIDSYVYRITSCRNCMTVEPKKEP